MPVTIGGLIIEPQGQTLVVAVTTAGGATPTLYSDAAGTTAHAFPVTISSRTRFYVTTPLVLTVSIKLNGQEIASQTGTTILVDVQPGVVQEITPGVNSPGAEVVGQNTAYVSQVAPPTGNATTDRANITAALARLPASGGKLVFPAGTYSLAPIAQSGFSTSLVLLPVPTGVHVQGQGVATVFKLPDNYVLPGGSALNLVQNTVLTGGDTDIVLSDFMVDGNGANQTELYGGVQLTRTRRCRIVNVTVKNVRGTGASPPGETFGISLSQCFDTRMTDCLVYGVAGTQGSGFGGNQSTNTVYENCISYGMSAGMGFTSWKDAGVSYVNCAAYSCGAHGFNCEEGADVIYDNCRSGGITSQSSGGYFGYANSTPVGNTGAGFTINGSAGVTLSNCVARYNSTGITVVTGSGDCTRVVIVGGQVTENGYGITFGNAGNALGSKVSKPTLVAGNTTANFQVNDGVVGNFGGTTGEVFLLPAPTFPASTVTFTNPYPFDVCINLTGAGITVLNINGANYNIKVGTVLLDRGGTIAATYTGSPVWVWLRR